MRYRRDFNERLCSFYEAISRDVQLDLKVLWGGHLARPDWAGKMPTPQFSGILVVPRVISLL